MTLAYGALSAPAQAVNTAQQVTLLGLRSSNQHGSFAAGAYGPDGSLYLLLDEHDGVRLLKADGGGQALLAQAHMGAAGDSGVAMALDPAGNVYVAGTTTSGSLNGTAGAAFGGAADSSTNSFVAKYDANLNLIFLSFLGAGRTAASAVAATADAVFVTGITFNTAFPVTPAGIQQTPATGSSENGFVERFSADGSTLVYATYLTGAGGTTVPAGIAADASDAAYVTGTTSASGYPTIAALQAEMLGTTSGFLSKLTAAGDGFTFSTFVAGAGLTGLALDSATNTLLVSGNVSLGQFPVATVSMPLTSASYQTLLRVSLDGQTVKDSVLLVPGSGSLVSVGASGTAWVSGALTTPLFPGTTAPDYTAGDSFLLHVTAQDAIDQTLRFGGVAVNDASYASLTSTVAAPAVSANTVTLPGSLTASVSASLLASQRFDLPMVGTPNALLPSALRDLLPSAAACGTSSVCVGTGALLASVAVGANAPSLSLSADNAPNVTLRNLGSATATGVSITASGFSVGSNCETTLAASSECSIALSGAGPGSVTVTAANAVTASATLATNALTPDAIVVSTRELDFGIVTSVDGAATETITVTNLSGASQTFTSGLDGGASKTAYTLAEAGSDCASGGMVGVHGLAANGVCHITLSLTASSTGANDGAVRAVWKIGTSDITVTGFAQAAATNLSASEVDFGAVIAGGPTLPRYLYLSNDSKTAVEHATVALPAASPFTVNDGCPAVLAAQSVCQIALGYAAGTASSADAVELTLDNGASVLLTGRSQPAASASGSSVDPSLNLSATAVSFATPVVVTGVSGAMQTVTVRNTGTVGFGVAVAVEGDFTLTNGCPGVLPGGASCSLLVGFAPSQPGTREGLLSVTAGNGFAPSYVALSGTGTAILPENNGVLALGATPVGEPAVAWYKVQQALTSLTAVVGGEAFGVALVQDTGYGHGTLPATGFGSSATATCGNCWLGVQMLAQTAGTQSATLTLTTVSGGNPYVLTVTGTALPVSGLLLSPQTQDFGTVTIHSSSAAATLALANVLSPSEDVTVQSVTASGDFSVVRQSSGASCSGTLAATASCFVQVAFSPTAVGERSGTLTVTTSGGTATAALTGYGLADPGLAISPASLVFANVPGTMATQQTVTLINTGSGTLTVGAVTASDPSFGVSSACGTLAAGGMCSVVVNFTPQAAQITATLAVPVSGIVNGQGLTTTYSVPLASTYTSAGAGLEILPGQVNFGAVATGTTGGTRQFTVNNLSAKALNVTLQLPRQFPLTTPAACSTLAVGASCILSVSFVPETAGELTGTLSAQGVSADGSLTTQALTYLSGYGVGAATLTVTGNLIPNAPLNFGQVTSGQSTQQTLTLSNSGTGTLTVRRISSGPPFLATTTCGAALASGASCSVTVSYAPVDELASGSAAGPRADAGTLTIESDAASAPNVISLAGTAVAVTSGSPASSASLASFTLSEGALAFPNTAVGAASAAQSVTMVNTGSTTVHVLGTMTATDFTTSTTCGTLLPGATCSFSVQFTPTNQSTAAVRSGTLEIATDATVALEFVSLLGTASAAPLTVSPTALSFGSVNVGASGQQTVTVSNPTGAPVTLSSVAASGDYSAAGGSCATGSTLAAGASCTVIVTFAPTVTGTRTGTLSIASSATTLPLTVGLNGVGLLAQLTATPGALGFGNLARGAVEDLSVTLANTGSASVTGIAATLGGSGAAAYSVIVPCASTTLAPGQGCTVTVRFSPSSTGPETATLSVASSDPNGPATVALTGNGVAAGNFTLTVNGGSAASVTVASGTAANFPLLLTPVNGFSGPVALTCAAQTTALYASCSLLASTLTLTGTATQSSTATIGTEVKAGFTGGSLTAALLLLPLALSKRRRWGRWMLLAAASLAVGVAIAGCAGSSGTTAPGSGSGTGLLYTPAGSYAFLVTASSTGGTVVSSTVTLTVVVQ